MSATQTRTNKELEKFLDSLPLTEAQQAYEYLGDRLASKGTNPTEVIGSTYEGTFITREEQEVRLEKAQSSLKEGKGLTNDQIRSKILGR